MALGLHFKFSSVAEDVRAALEEVSLLGWDGSPVAATVEYGDGRLSVTGERHQSGALQITWPVAPVGRRRLQTASLMAQDAPYRLAVELARGHINLVSNQAAEWDLAGLRPSPESLELLRSAKQRLGRAIRTDDEAAATREAEQALEEAILCGERLTGEYSRQAIASRRRRFGMRSQLACCYDESFLSLEDPEFLRRLFDGVTIEPDWSRLEPECGRRDWGSLDRAVEWCLDRDFIVAIGPVVDLRPGRLPDWVVAESNHETQLVWMLDLVETCVQRYGERVKDWEATQGGNGPDGVGLSEARRMAITARLGEAIREMDGEARIALGIDRPWGDRPRRAERSQRTPFDYADQMLRADAPVQALSLEIAIGYGERGSAQRGALEFVQLLDRYRELESPLRVRLFHPSRRPGELEDAGAVGEAAQADWLENYVAAALAKPFVERVTWGRYMDRPGAMWPDSGLLDESGRPKRALKRLRAVRRACFRP
ncbi:MAG TPA: hypothetical protein VNC50_08130 [Planctomycetia bacterium]|nr:hypothetical protein [Planctomycetia bacterium]